MRLRLSIVLVTPFVAVGCSDLATDFEGTGAPVTVDTTLQVMPPAEPLPPVMTPCPTGWVENGGACEPWPAGSADCPSPTARFPGDAQCATLGSACPSGAWADALPAGRPVLYVQQGAAGGSGTKTAPFGTLAEALAAATATTVVALAAGTYATTGPIPAGVTLWGACVEKTAVTSTDPAQPVIKSTAPGVEVHNLKVTGGLEGLLAIGAQAQLNVEDVYIDGVQQAGLSVEQGAHATGKNVVIVHTQPLAGGTEGEGIQVLNGAKLNVTRLIVDDSYENGAGAIGAGAQLDMSDAVIRNTRAQQSSRNGGYGVAVDLGGAVSLTRAEVSKSHDTGVLALGKGTISLTDVVVRDTQTREADGQAGYGVLAIGSSVTGKRVLLERNILSGAKVRDSGGTLALTDAVIRLTAASSDPGSGSGVTAVSGAALSLERVVIDHNRGAAFALGSAGTTATAIDVVVSNTTPDLAGMAGQGIALLQGSHLIASRVRLEGNTWVGMSVQSSTRLEMSDLTVVGTRAVGSATASGVLLTAGPHASLTRALIRQNDAIGLLLEGAGSSLDLHDVAVEQTLPDGDGLEGEGLMVTAGAELTGARVRVTESKTVGLVAAGAGTRVALAQVQVSDSILPPCPGHPRCDDLQPTGVLVMDGAAMTLDQFLVTRNTGIGVQLATGGQLDLTDGEVSEHLIGVNLDADYDLARLSDRVRYVNNATKLGAMKVPLPAVPTF